MRFVARVLALALGVPSLAGAEVLVSNLANAAHDGYALAPVQWLTQGFVNDAETRALTSAYAHVGNNFGAGGIVAEIRTSLGDPGSVVGSFTPHNPALTLLPVAPIVLAPNTTYYLVLGFPLGNPNTMGSWKATTDLSSTGPGSLVVPRASNDQGATWSTVGLTLQRLRVELVVPEPATNALGAIAIAALAVVARQRSRRAIQRCGASRSTQRVPPRSISTTH